MNLVQLATEIAAAVDTITGLQVHATPGLRIAAPALVVGYPADITFDATYGRGSDALVVPLFLLVGPASARAGGLDLLAYCSGSGSKSIKAAVEAADYTAADVVRVATCSTGAISAEGVEFLGATFDLQVHGRN